MIEMILYGTGGTLPPIAELYELTGSDAITQIGEPVATAFVVTWADVTVTLRLLVADDAARALADLRLFAEGYLGARDDSKARKNLRRITAADTAVAVTIEPDTDPDHKARNLVLGVLAWYPDSTFLGDGALYNENAKRFLGDDSARPRFFVEPLAYDSEEALARKARSIAALRRDKIPYISHLPVIADSTQISMPALPAMAERLIALVAIADKAEGGSTADYEQRVETLGVRAAVTPDEWEYAHTDEPIEQDTIKFSQRLEAAWTLAWALGLVATLEQPVDFCDSEALHALAVQSPPQMVKRAEPRAASAILEATDLHYRYHWAVNDAELYGTRLPVNLLPAVVYERHYALNWLLSAAPWDSVTTDT